IRVAIAARPHQSRVNIRRHVHYILYRLRGGKRGIRPRHRKELRHHKTNHQNNHHPLKSFSHEALSLSPYSRRTTIESIENSGVARAPGWRRPFFTELALSREGSARRILCVPNGSAGRKRPLHARRHSALPAVAGRTSH